MLGNPNRLRHGGRMIDSWKMRATAATGLAGLLLGGCVQDIKQARVETALVRSGLSRPLAECMGRRLAAKLSIAQLRRLQALGGEKRGYSEYVEAVRRVRDPEALAELVASYGMCRAGIIR